MNLDFEGFIFFKMGRALGGFIPPELVFQPFVFDCQIVDHASELFRATAIGACLINFGVQIASMCAVMQIFPARFHRTVVGEEIWGVIWQERKCQLQATRHPHGLRISW